MKKKQFDGTVTEVISNQENLLFSTIGLVGDAVYKLCIYNEKGVKSINNYYLLATLDETLLCMENIREDLDKFSAEKMFEDISKRVEGYLAGKVEKPEVYVVTTDETEEILKQPILLKISTNDLSLDDIKHQKALCLELNDWLDALKVMISANVSQKEMEAYQQEYAKIMNADLIPHDEDSVKSDYSSTMCTITTVFAVISIFFHSMCVFPVIAVMCGIFSSYRCYTNKNKIAAVICLIGIAVGVVFTYIGWQEMYTSMIGNRG